MLIFEPKSVDFYEEDFKERLNCHLLPFFIFSKCFVWINNVGVNVCFNESFFLFSRYR